MDQKSLKLDKKGLNMDCRYKGRYVVFLYMSFCSKKLSVDEDVCVLIFATFRPNIGPILYSCPRQSSIFTKMQQDQAKGSRLERGHF